MYNCSNNKKYYDKCEFHDIIYKDSYKYFYWYRIPIVFLGLKGFTIKIFNINKNAG